MLTQLHITNFITIHSLQLDFLKGTTVITGETGAGKSILIDAIELALGGRASTDMIRTGQDKTDISLVFDVTKLSEAREWLKNYDLQSEGSECIIRRILSKDGRSRSYINNMPTTLQPLRELGELLISIHGQHEHQSILKPMTQRNLLDRYAGHHSLVDKVRNLAEEWNNLSEERHILQQLSKERQQRREFLKFQITELENLNLIPDEFQNLDQEHKQLAHSGELLQNITHALVCLTDDEEHNAMHLLQHVIQSLEMVQRIDPKIASWTESLKNAMIQLSDTEDDLRRYLDNVNIDPERLYHVENRLSLLFDIGRKYKVSPQELYDLQQTLTKEYVLLENTDEKLIALKESLESLEKHYHEVAHRLSQSRLKAAKKLAQQITETIKELALPQAEFHVLFEMEDFSHPLAHGMERVIFEIKTNSGQPLQSLSKIASGGELSRISLAIHLATAEQHPIPTLIFDEVDVGIGGGTAETVGKLLRRLGKTHQIICITHAPQVAAQGHHHLCVEKRVQEDVTFTSIKELAHFEKINELARMLGGIEITKTTLDHAKEMIESILSNPRPAQGN